MWKTQNTTGQKQVMPENLQTMLCFYTNDDLWGWWWEYGDEDFGDVLLCYYRLTRQMWAFARHHLENIQQQDFFFSKNNINDLVQAWSKLLMGFKNAKCIDVYQIKAMNKKCRKQNWSNQHHHHRQHQHHNHNRR